MIRVDSITKKFGSRTILNNLSLVIPEGQMTVIMGRSGEGKSLLLKQIIGLIKPDAGQILIDNVDITTLSDAQLNQQLAKFGYVFQFAALLDSLTVWENIGITLLNNGVSKQEIWPTIKEMLSLVHLPENTLYKYPAELSGGMAKRVGLARTLITRPQIILYDEPTSGLDPLTERRIHELMRDLQQKLCVTSIVITHSTDIFDYADHIAFLHKGTIAYTGPTKNIWECDNPYIRQFIHRNNDGPIQTDE